MPREFASQPWLIVIFGSVERFELFVVTGLHGLTRSIPFRKEKTLDLEFMAELRPSPASQVTGLQLRHSETLGTAQCNWLVAIQPNSRRGRKNTMSNNPKPTNIVLHQKSHELEISFDDGQTFHYPAEFLRVYSPSAEVRGHVGDHYKLQVNKQDVNITDIKPVGQYAIKIFYDDKHDSGLYDWRYLYELGRKQAIYWTQYLDRLREAGHERQAPSWRKPH